MEWLNFGSFLAAMHARAAFVKSIEFIAQVTGKYSVNLYQNEKFLCIGLTKEKYLYWRTDKRLSWKWKPLQIGWKVHFNHVNFNRSLHLSLKLEILVVEKLSRRNSSFFWRFQSEVNKTVKRAIQNVCAKEKRFRGYFEIQWGEFRRWGFRRRYFTSISIVVLKEFQADKSYQFVSS